MTRSRGVVAVAVQLSPLQRMGPFRDKCWACAGAQSISGTGIDWGDVSEGDKSVRQVAPIWALRTRGIMCTCQAYSRTPLSLERLQRLFEFLSAWQRVPCSTRPEPNDRANASHLAQELACHSRAISVVCHSIIQWLTILGLRQIIIRAHQNASFSDKSERSCDRFAASQ